MPRTPLTRWIRIFLGQPMVIALATAVALTTALTIVVLVPLLRGSGGGAEAPAAVAAVDAPPLDLSTATATATATPRPTVKPEPSQISNPSPTPDASARGDARGARVAAPATKTPTPKPPPTRTPEPRATQPPVPPPTTPPTPTPTTEPTVVAYYLAEAGDGLQAWSGPSWTSDGRMLVNDGSATVAQPWIVGPVVPPTSGGYAIEADLRVDGVTPGFCMQSLGLVAPLSGGTFIGAGWVYECDAAGKIIGARARLTDISDYTNGYFQDPEFAAAPLKADEEWHTVRLEVDDGRVRLLIDGEIVLTTTAGAEVAQNPQSALGLWSEGVELTVRRISVEELTTG